MLLRKSSDVLLTGFFHSVVNTSGGTSSLHLVEELQLAALRQALVGELGIVEVAADADIEIVEQLLVGFLEVEGQGEGAAHARILELLAALVEDERLHRRHALHRDRLLLDEALLYGGEIVARRPLAGGALDPIVELAGLELLERRRAVEEVRQPELVEVNCPLA